MEINRFFLQIVVPFRYFNMNTVIQFQKEKLALWLSESAEGVDPGADWSPNFQVDNFIG